MQIETIGNATLYHGDCLDILPLISGVDAVITDPPYGTTENDWDVVPDLAAWWSEIMRVCKGAVVMTASQPFTSEMVVSNRQWFKWADVWKKTQARGHLNAKIMPLRQHEDILVFGAGRITYNPQLVKKPAYNIRPNTPRTKGSSNYGEYGLESERGIPLDMSYPRSVVEVENCQEYEHPTQKPVKLLQKLITLFTDPGEVVIDPVAGSASTIIAAIRTGRSAYGFEIKKDFFKAASDRIGLEQQQNGLFTQPKAYKEWQQVGLIQEAA